MINSNLQLILSFEMQSDNLDNTALLSVSRSESEYFTAQKTRSESFKVELPHPFRETALMDSKGWRKKRQAAASAQDLGRRMWLNLPEHLRQDVLAANPEKPLRVGVASHSNGLDDIPWEWLSSETGEPLAATESVRFLRLVPTLYAPPPLSIAPPIRVLIVLTNPKDERLLQSNIEIDVVTRGLSNKPEYEVRLVLEPRIDALEREMEWFPHVIHYIGHAGINGNQGCLILHNEQEGTRWLSAAETARFLPSSVKLVCLSTCVSAENYQIGGLNRFAHCPSEVPLPTTIVNQYALDQIAATNFWSAFYPALLHHDGNIVEAFHESRMIVKKDETTTWDWASFSLVVRDGVGHPFRISQELEFSQNRYEAEVQAQLTARLANKLASRISTLDSKYQEHWETSMAAEASRLESFEKEIDDGGKL